MINVSTLPSGLLAPPTGKPISSWIVDSITDMILAGELKPGDQLPTEAEFTETYHVGRNTFREAIKMLSSIGVIEIRRGEGTFVAESLSASAINPLIFSLLYEQGTSSELIELRLLLEIGAAQLLVEKMEDGDIEELEEANNLLLAEVNKADRDAERLLALDMHFHDVFLNLTRNKLLAKLYRAVARLFYASVKKSVNMAPIKAYENHRLIIEALKKRDMVLVRSSTIQSFSHWIAILEEEPNSSDRNQGSK